MKKRNKSIFGKLILGQAIVSIISVFAIGILVNALYMSDSLKYTTESAFAITRSLAEYIDGDTIDTYYTTLEEDEYYYEIAALLSAFQENSQNVKYVYVFVPEDETLTYIWDTDPDHTDPLGYQETYSEGGKAEVEATFCTNPKEELFAMNDEYGNIRAAYSPIFDSDGNPVALVGVDVSVPDLAITIIKFLLIVAVCIAVINTLALIGNIFYMNHLIVKPVTVLKDATRSMVSNLENDEDVQINIHTRDELDDLARDFEHMHAEVKDYLVKLNSITAEKERISTELNMAEEIQASSLPKVFPCPPNCTEVSLFADMDPAKEVGGDFYDFFWIDQDHFAMVMADVSGKGVPAALFMMISKALIKATVQMVASPGEVLTAVNNRLLEGNDAAMFVTVWLGILDVNTGEITAANAGHEFPAIRRKDGQFELFEDKHDLVLAAIEDMEYSDYQMKLEPGDTLFLYTDGAPEATAADETMYGTDGLLTALNKEPDADMETLVKNVKAGINEFVKDAPQFDDITLMGIRFNGRQE